MRTNNKGRDLGKGATLTTTHARKFSQAPCYCKHLYWATT
jgi:hypothetical protein